MEKLNESFIEVKKSKFIGYMYSVDSIDEVEKIISSLKEEHKKARHVVYAYKIGGQEKNYGDKEPGGTTRGLLDLIHYKNLDISEGRFLEQGLLLVLILKLLVC